MALDHPEKVEALKMEMTNQILLNKDSEFGFPKKTI